MVDAVMWLCGHMDDAVIIGDVVILLTRNYTFSVV